MNRVRDDIAIENSLQRSVLSTRSHILEAIAGLGGFGALAIGLYFQIAVIRRLNRLRNYMRDDKSVQDPGALIKGTDEISEMAQAFVHYSNEIKQREDALRESELRFRHLFESAPISIWAEDWSEAKRSVDELRERGITDLRSYFRQHPDFIQGLRRRIRWIDMNGATLRLYGAESKEALRDHIRDVASVDGYPETIVKFSEGARQFSEEISDTRIDGSSIRVIETYHMSEEDSRDWSRVVACMLDITDRKRAEEQLQIAKDQAETALEDLKQTQQNLIQSEKMASLGQLTAGIAHEIKNPLNFINNFSDVSVELLSELQRTLSSTIGSLDKVTSEEITDLFETIGGNLAKIREHGQRADRIVRSMLSHAREGSTEPASTDLNMLVEDALNLAYHGARAENPRFNVTLERHYDDSVGLVTILPQEMTRVLLNLIGNGFYATQKRGETDPDRAYKPTLSVATRDLADAVEIRVRDNGTGIPTNVVDKIFNPFFTTKPTGEGTGLGLSLSYEIVVRQHNGKFEVATEEGNFTEFTVILPRKQSLADIKRGAAQ
jgi:PAS domain S-box-containing protein